MVANRPQNIKNGKRGSGGGGMGKIQETQITRGKGAGKGVGGQRWGGRGG